MDNWDKLNYTIDKLSAMREKNKAAREKERKIGLIVGGILALFVSVILPIILVHSENKRKDNSAKVEDLIEQGDFVEAKKLAKSSKVDDGDKMLTQVVKAQVSTLVDRGDLSLASDVAKEENRYGIYFNIILERLVPLYESNKQGMFMALAQLRFPSEGSKYSDWDGEDHYFWDDEGNKKNIIIGKGDLNSFYTSFNNSLSQLMSYAKANGDKDTIGKLGAFLKPLYKLKKTENGDEYEDNPTDYTQANQIKKEFRVK